jgi:hypothetical protein
LFCAVLSWLWKFVSSSLSSSDIDRLNATGIIFLLTLAEGVPFLDE